MATTAPDPALLSIHSEVLFFVANKFQSVPFEALANGRADFYGSEKVHAAKELPFGGSNNTIIPWNVPDQVQEWRM